MKIRSVGDKLLHTIGWTEELIVGQKIRIQLSLLEIFLTRLISFWRQKI